MDKKKLFGIVAVMAATSALTLTVAQADPPVGANPTGPAVDVAGTPNASGGVSYRAKELIGATVTLEGGTSAGTIEDIVIEDNGNVEFVIVSIANKQLVAIPWAAARYDATQRVIFVNIAPERFRQIPTFVVGRYPVFTAPAFRTQVYGFFNLQAGQRRGNRVDVRTNRIDYNGRTPDGRDRRPSDRRDDTRNRVPDNRTPPATDRDPNDRRNDTRDRNPRPANPPVTNPPATNPPADNPPATNPGATNPPSPPKTNPPKAAPPAPRNPAPKKPAPQDS